MERQARCLTKHETIEMTTQGSNRTPKLKCITEYNKGMNGIDLQDQILACYPVMRKYMKGYKKIFFYHTFYATK